MGGVDRLLHSPLPPFPLQDSDPLVGALAFRKAMEIDDLDLADKILAQAALVGTETDLFGWLKALALVPDAIKQNVSKALNPDGT